VTNGKPNIRAHVLQSSGKNTRCISGSKSEINDYTGGQSGVKRQTFVGKRDLKGFPSDVSEENWLPLDRPGIIEAAHVMVRSEMNKSGQSLARSFVDCGMMSQRNTSN
jgi:hypothetical protein